MKKTKWNKLVWRFLSGILILLGFSSCTGDNEDDWGNVRLEYGSPTASLEIKGKVTDQTDTPVKDIQVVFKYIYKNNPAYYADTLYTDSLGEIHKDRLASPNSLPVIDMRVYFNDENGVYESDSIDIRTKKVENGSGWYNGKGLGTFEKKLKKK